ncbi:MAG: hypothetical protein WAN10_14040 [Candidatus Acidiferrales bacterium]
MSSSDLAPVLVFVSMTIGVAWIVWVVSNNKRRQRIAEVQREMQAKLFEKFGTSQELIEYLKTDAGSKFLDSATIEHARPFGRVLGSVQAGLILFFLGIAMFIVRATMPNETFNAVDRAQTAHGFLAVSLLLLALGFGFLASAAASYRLSKAWGLFDRELGPKR